MPLQRAHVSIGSLSPHIQSGALLESATEARAKLPTFLAFILFGALIFFLTLYGVNGHLWVQHPLTSLPGGQIGFAVARARSGLWTKVPFPTA